MEQINELNQLKAEQALHRQQLEENRQRALSKRNQIFSYPWKNSKRIVACRYNYSNQR